MLCVCVFVVWNDQVGKEKKLQISLYTVAGVLCMCLRVRHSVSACSVRVDKYREKKSKMVFLLALGGP